MWLPDLIAKLKKGQVKIFNFEADFSKLTHLIKTGAIKLKLFSDNTKTENHLHIDNSKHLTINIPDLSQDSQDKLKNILHELKEDGHTLLEDKSNSRFNDIITEEQTDASKKALEFFRDKISSQDLAIVRAALYIKSLFDKGERNLDLLKADIRHKHGQRGNNIVNLCSAEYFENYLIPYHEHLVKTEADKQEISRKFSELFNILATELPFTVFVYHDMTDEKIVKQVALKLKYGAEFVNIHGIGEHNVSTINKALEEIKKAYGEENIATDITKEKKIIKVRIELKRKTDSQ